MGLQPAPGQPVARGAKPKRGQPQGTPSFSEFKVKKNDSLAKFMNDLDRSILALTFVKMKYISGYSFQKRLKEKMYIKMNYGKKRYSKSSPRIMLSKCFTK